MRIAILGAGISGLASAWFLKEHWGKEADIVIIEQSKQAGGWIETIEKDRFLFELGPRSCRSKGLGIETLKLIEALGLKDEIITANKTAHKRYLYTGQRLHKVPNGIVAAIFSPLSQGVFRSCLRDWITPKGEIRDESIYDFFTRRFSSAIAERFIDPLASGIYAGDIRQLSIRSCFPIIYQAEQSYGSVTKGMLYGTKKDASLSPLIKNLQRTPLFSLKKGMRQLTDTLCQKLDAQLLFATKALSLEASHKNVRILLSDQSVLNADLVISSLSPKDFAHLLAGQDPIKKMALKLSYASVAVVCLGYNQPLLKANGFGYLIPSIENEEILGVVWDSSVFPQHNRYATETRLTVMMGGSNHPDIADWTEDRCLRIAKEAVRKHLNIYEQPDMSHVKIAKDAIPQYVIGHEEWKCSFRQMVKDYSSRIHLAGSAYDGVSVNDCIANAKGLAYILPLMQ